MKLRGFMAGVGVGVAVVGVAAVAVMREVRRKREIEVFGDAISKVTGDITRSVVDILNPRPPWAPDVVPVERMTREEIEARYPTAVPGATAGDEKLPWYLGGPDDIPADADLDPTNIDGPLDTIQPMQPGSIGPVLPGGIFNEPMPEGEWQQDREGPRTVAFDHDTNPFEHLGLKAPVTDITGDGQ